LKPAPAQIQILAIFDIGDELITGDTLFVFGCGRCDLSGGDPEVMHDTLKKLAKLPEQTIILPGHNYADKETCSMHEQLEGNPFMHFADKNDFVHYRMHEHDRIRHSPYHAVPKN